MRGHVSRQFSGLANAFFRNREKVQTGRKHFSYDILIGYSLWHKNKFLP